jgi:hypothetical protein
MIDEQKRKEALKRFKANLKKRPQVSDKDFMAETEVPHKDYAKGLTLPGIK